MSMVDRAEELQRRHHILGYPLAVIYKFFDDQGNYLAMAITCKAFVAVFPLLLISSSVLGFLLQGNRAFQRSILDSALSEFPIIGTQLSAPQGLQGSVSAVIVGAVVALYGVLGLGQALQNVVSVAWSVPPQRAAQPVHESAVERPAVVPGRHRPTGSGHADQPRGHLLRVGPRAHPRHRVAHLPHLVGGDRRRLDVDAALGLTNAKSMAP